MASSRRFPREMILQLDCVTNAKLSFHYQHSLRQHLEPFSLQSRHVLSVNSWNCVRSTFASLKASSPILNPRISMVSLNGTRALHAPRLVLILLEEVQQRR